MYLINITVHENVSEAQQAEMFPKHAAWFQKHFAAGNFLLLGPYTDTEAHVGMIIAHTENRAELEAILNEDCYYPNFAHYEIREFAPKMAAENIYQLI